MDLVLWLSWLVLAASRRRPMPICLMLPRLPRWSHL